MKAYELLNSPEKWTQGAYARDKYNETISSESPAAVKWCVHGAITKCYGRAGAKGEECMMRLIHQKGSVSRWNDSRLTTWEEVRATLKELDI